MLKALIFDFDGLILDTETPEVFVWQSIYKDHGFELPMEEWKKTVGGYGISTFDAAEHLALLSSGRLDPLSSKARYRTETETIIHASPPCGLDPIDRIFKDHRFMILNLKTFEGF